MRVDAPSYAWLDAASSLVAKITQPRFLAGTSIPILFAGAGSEAFVEPEAHRRAARLFPERAPIEFPDSKHEPFLERDAIRDRAGFAA